MKGTFNFLIEHIISMQDESFREHFIEEVVKTENEEIFRLLDEEK